MLKAPTPAAYAVAQRWMNLPVVLLLVALAGFAHHYLDARLRWLAVTAIALRLVSLVINFTVGESGNFLHTTSLHSVPLLGEQVSLAIGVRNPWRVIGQIAVFLLMLYFDCRIGARLAARSTRRRRAGRRQPHLLHGGEPGPGVRRFLVGRRGAEHRQSLRPRRRRRHGLRAQRRPAARQAARRRAERARARGRLGRRRRQSRHLDARQRPRQPAGEQEIARAVRLRARGATQYRAAGAAGSRRRPRGLSRPLEPGGEKARRLPERVSPRLARRPAALDHRARARRPRRQGATLAQSRCMHRCHREKRGRAGDAPLAPGHRPRRPGLGDGPDLRGAGARDQSAARRDPAQRRGGGPLHAARVARPAGDQRDPGGHPQGRPARQRGDRPDPGAAPARGGGDDDPQRAQRSGRRRRRCCGRMRPPAMSRSS